MDRIIMSLAVQPRRCECCLLALSVAIPGLVLAPHKKAADDLANIKISKRPSSTASDDGFFSFCS